ncbi:MAG: hypothetical protein IJJ44_06175 [Solobacterium sp.]|nr:hypothetical protein [Solobacterium sp.]
MKFYTPDHLTRFLIFAAGCFFIVDLLAYAVKEWRRISHLNRTGTEVKAVFTNIKSEIIKRKMKSTADLAYTTQNGETIRYLWEKGFFDEEVLLFRNTDKKKLDVTVKYDPENPKDMYVVDCYNQKKHILVMGLCVLSAVTLGYCLLIA